MKRVAIIGCSHSDYDLRPHSWVKFCAQDFPHLHFDVFAQGGHGHLYMDLVLKDIWDTFDHYIVQLTQPTRWMLGFQGDLSTPAFIRYDTDVPNISDWKFNQPRVAMPGSSTLTNPEIAKNYGKVFDSFKSVTHGGTFYNYTPGDDSTKITVDFKNNIHPLAYHFSRVFVKNLAMYGDRISYFNHGSIGLEQVTKVDHWEKSESVTNNIGVQESVFEYLEKNYYDKFLNYIDETNHLNLTGSQVLWQEYLKPSSLGERLSKL